MKEENRTLITEGGEIGKKFRKVFRELFNFQTQFSHSQINKVLYNRT